MSTPAPRAPADGLDALSAITDAVESGAGLPEVVRAAARALDASLAVADRWGGVLAVAARSSADERSLLAGAEGVEIIDLRVADDFVGQLRMRQASDAEPPAPALKRIVTALIASEVQRVRAPAHASAEAVAEFFEELLDHRITDEARLSEHAARMGVDLGAGASIVVVRARVHVPVEEGWRERVAATAARGARTVIREALAAPSPRVDPDGAEILVLLPGGEAEAAARAVEAMLRELRGSLAGHSFALGRSRVARTPAELTRAVPEALLAANVAAAGSGDPNDPAEDRVLAFEETGAYRLLLPAMTEDPGELQRFYQETIAPLVAYDEQYGTDLVRTVETYLEVDGNVAGAAQRLYTHRHTVRYRLERVRDLTGLDVSSSDGRERLSLGLKAMRVLGIAARTGPSAEG